jgi:hypothetical protein
MKRILLIFITLTVLTAASESMVFDVNPGNDEDLAPKISAFRLDQAAVRINGKNVQVTHYGCSEPVKKVLEAFLDKAEKQGKRTVNNQYLWLAANALFKGAGSGLDADSFGYIFIMDKNNEGLFVVAGSYGNDTEIIKAQMSGCGSLNTGGYADGVRHYPGAEKFLSIEFLSGEKTLNFGNFYRISGTDRLEMRSYYFSEFKKGGWEVLKKEQGKDADRYMLRRENNEIFLNIGGGDNGEALIFVMG